MQDLTWIAVDWGTSNFRAWGFDDYDRLLCETHSDKGMSKLCPGDFEGALLDAIGGWLPKSGHVPLYACGMVGARQGWVEAPYAKVPCRPTTNFIEAPTTDERLQVFIAAGLCQSAPNDVMRGEETQVAGLLARNETWSGTICLPGTHSKWVRVTDGKVAAFQTFMTGELYAACKNATVLRHSISCEDFIIDVFEDTVKAILQEPEQAPAQFFSIRANGLLSETCPADASSRLSGILIAMELASIRAKWAFETVTLVGDPSLCRRYGRALQLAGVRAEPADAKALTLAGLTAARNSHVCA